MGMYRSRMPSLLSRYESKTLGFPASAEFVFCQLVHHLLTKSIGQLGRSELLSAHQCSPPRLWCDGRRIGQCHQVGIHLHFLPEKWSTGQRICNVVSHSTRLLDCVFVALERKGPSSESSCRVLKPFEPRESHVVSLNAKRSAVKVQSNFLSAKIIARHSFSVVE
ncbi:hypothetical protein ISCGN_026078 [Ixodes scapularis]